MESHRHDHHHPAPSGGRALFTALLITAGYSLIEAAGGLWADSLTLMGDAGHMLTDAVALGLAALAAWLATRPPSAKHSFGLGRAEVVAALLNALFMLGIVTFIAAEAIDRLNRPVPVQGLVVTLVAGVGLGLNILVAYMLSRGGKTINIRAALLHVIGDLLGSVAALSAGVVIQLTGWTLIDPILALLVCLLILYSTLQLIRESLHIVMEGVPPHLDLPTIGHEMAALPGVVSVHDLHIWTLDSGRVALSAHVVIKKMSDWTEVQPALSAALLERGISHITLQPETPTFILHPMPPLKGNDS